MLITALIFGVPAALGLAFIGDGLCFLSRKHYERAASKRRAADRAAVASRREAARKADHAAAMAGIDRQIAESRARLAALNVA